MRRGAHCYAVMELKRYKIMLFETVSLAMKAEKILKAEGIPFKLIPIPKEISPDCGICLRFTTDMEEKIAAVLSDKLTWNEIRSLE